MISPDIFLKIFKANPLPALILFPDAPRFTIAEVNSAFLKSIFKNEEDLIGKSIFEVFPKKRRTKNRTNTSDLSGSLEKVLTSGLSDKMEIQKYHFSLKTSDEPEERFWETENIPVLAESGKVEYIIQISVDVTEKEIALRQLRSNQKKLLAAQDLSKIGYWKFDIQTNTLFWSDKIYEMWGVSKASFKPDFKFFFQSVHPNDRDIFIKERSIALSGEKELNIEFRINTPDQSIKWIHEIGKLIRNEKGEDVSFEGTVQDITEAKLLKLSLEESNQRYHYVTKATFDAIYDWDFLTDICYWGEGFQKSFGYDLKALSDKTFWEKHIHPEDHDRVENEIRKSASGNETNWLNEYRFQKANGNYADVLDRSIIIRDKNGKAIRMVGAIQDITEKKTLQQLLDKADRLARIGSWEIDVESATVYWSDIVKEIRETPKDFKPSLQEGITHFKEGYSKETIIARVKEAVKYGTPWQEDLQIYTHKGNLKWIRSIGKAEFANGKCKKIYGSFQDIDATKKTEIELKELHQNLQKTANDLTASNAELEQFAYIASHDLQEPLRMVTGFLSQLEKRYSDIIDEKGKQYIYFAVDGAKRMRQIILDLLEFSRVGRFEGKLEEVDTNKMIHEITALYKTQIEEAKAVIHFDNLPVVKSYKSPLRQVFQNLLGNALKYQKKGIPPIINIEAEEFPENWQFSIKDNGIGIEPCYHDRIFTIFQRLHNKDEYSGTGIGLAIVKKIVEALGGSIWIKSNKDEGSIFFFTIKR